MKKPEISEVAEGVSREVLPVAPSMGPALESVSAPQALEPVDRRVVFISGVAILLAIAAGFVAQLLTAIIHLFTNIAFFGRFSAAPVSPADNTLGAWVIVVPVLGAILVGLMARYGSRAIRGHGIPEAMEQVLFNQSRIPPRVTFLKPLSAAVAIGTGGPFGAEGPIIATGGALGSFVGQLLKVTADERKALLAAGAAAGMAATFGAPVSAVLLAVELLLFEYRPRSVIPVALATATATGVRIVFTGGEPAFAMPDLVQPGGAALACYILLGGVVGLASVFATRAVYAIEDAFEKLPLHWMWWPALGGVVVGVVGYFAPRTLGVGYTNIEDILSGRFVGTAMLFFCLMKFLSWSIALGSGTSGGTLAPLFTIGGGLGSALGALLVWLAPGLGMDVRIAALVGMAAIFAGASRALLASVVFAFETTRQPLGLLPLLGGCTAAYLVSTLLMRHSIMTEKIARRGGRVPTEYAVDALSHALVRDHGLRSVVTLLGEESLETVRAWLASGVPGTSHQGFPVLDANGGLVGVVTRRDLLDGAEPGGRRVRELIRRPPAVAFEDSTLREAADHMVREGVGRLPVVRRDAPERVVGILTRSDLLAAHQRRLDAAHRREQGIGGAKRPPEPRVPHPA
ncbi:chloride channel protein [Hyalangium rubrum]|uniref:Chloride channel protein n=1 Tax=Hyalangium rubrum TaxID=3103134 RepID=A0ABU5H6V9_9BACT|nr:chloride channel protein [Hyalangium sp. s54d21]MDY7227830.1 chloride channel protein [Hyalangium sp. s54d21]